MKRAIIFAVVCIMLISITVFTSCSKSNAGKLICGVTDFEPINFRDAKGNWTGFDTELAMLVGEKLKMKVEFQEIEWGSKYNELEAGTINAIWNGFTANASESDGRRRSEMVDFSYSYLRNQQSVVIKADRAREFRSIYDLAGKTAAAEAGSAGESFVVENIGDAGKFIGSPAQISTFIEVKSGAVDFAVVDILLAQRLAGSGDYSDLAVADITLDFEVYAVGLKKGSELTEKVNKALKELYDEGKMLELAKKYGLEDSLVLDTNFKG
ncbi:MAG: transporter substrate-binding domain-containing protein [Treponema sp.]|jgi:polar amino acid transport system substrate-binding protein|nr:transporter substrate-binding domain-containing protein [Treponema sp.]